MIPVKWRALTLILVIAGGILAVLFGVRTLRALREFQIQGAPPVFSEGIGPMETDVELIRDWMTVPFVSEMYRVRQPVLFEALGIPERGNRDKSLRQLNEEYFPEAPGIVEAKIKAIILENISPLTPTDTEVPAP